MSVDLAATFAPVQAPLRDWLRERVALIAVIPVDANGKRQIYAGGLPPAADPASGPAIAFHTAGGLAGGTALDRPFVRFTIWANSAATAETVAYVLRAELDRVPPGTALGLAAAPSQVRLAGADTAPPIFVPDPGSNTPRFVVTSTLTVQAVST